MRALRLSTWLMGAVLLVSACGKSSGTYARLSFSGAVATDKPIASIAVDLQFVGGPAATTSFALAGGKPIVLPTDAILEVRSGAGALVVAARALAQDGSLLGTGAGTGTVVRDQTVQIDVVFGVALPDGGADVRAPVEAALPLPDGPVQPALDSGNDLRSSSDDAVGPLDAAADAAGSGGAGGTDAPLGGAGGATGGAGGAIGTGGAIGSGGAGGASPTYLLTATPPAADFGNVAVGSVSPPLTITIGNTGQVPTPPLVIFVGDGEHFAIASAGCDGVSLAPGQTCLVAFTFKATAAGLVRADAAVGPSGGVPVKLGLVGNGTVGGPPLALSPATVDFKIVDVGLSSAIGFTVTNLATTSLGGFTVTTTGASAFAIADDGCAGVTLAPQARCGFNVVFAPTTLGSVAGAVNVVLGTMAVASSPLTGVGRDYVPLTIGFAGTGGGAVTAANQSCASPGPCTLKLPRTDPAAPPKLDLVAKPDALSTFLGWAGDCAGSGACTVVMDGPRTVTAKLEARKVTLNLEVLGLAGHQGSVVSSDGLVSCSGICPGLTHPATNSLTLTVKPAGSSTFVGWGGGPCKGTAPSCTFALTDTTSVTATFGPQSYMFVTSSTVVPGNLGGIAGADAECKRLASAARLPGTYRAWLSTKGNDAKGRVGQGGWVRTDGRPFTISLSRLIETSSPTVYYPPRIDENGNDLGNKVIPVATGGLGDGTALDSQCADYTQPSGSLYVGEAAAGVYWGYRQLESNGCGTPHRLYCFRSDAVASEIVPPAQPGRRVFVSSRAFVPGTSGDPDVLCQKDADAAGLANPGGYLALIATSSSPALRRVAAGAPWKRADEVVVARHPDDFAKGTLLAPIALTADGSQYVAVYAWTGAADPSALGTSTCGDWQGVNLSGQGLVGDNQTTATPDWFAYLKVPCLNATARLLCIEP